MNVIISKEKFIKLIYNLKVGQKIEFSDMWLEKICLNKGDIIKDEYLEDFSVVEVIDFYDSELLAIGGFGGYTYATCVSPYDSGNKEEVDNLIERFFDNHPMENIVVDERVFNSDSKAE